MPKGRKIKVPEPITMIDIRSKKAISKPDGSAWAIDFAECVIEGLVMHDRRWSQNPLWMKARNQVLVALDHIDGGVFTLSENDFQMLLEVTNSPTSSTGQPGLGSFHAAVAPQLLPHLEAIINAEESIIP